MSSSRTNALHPSVGQIDSATGSKGNDRLLLGIIMGVLAFWLFAQTTLNIAPDMQKDLALDTGLMNTAVAITALFSGIFIVFGRPDRSRENRDGRLRAEQHWIAANWLRAAWRPCIIFSAAPPCAAGGALKISLGINRWRWPIW